jgi:hypothetical protein
MTMQRTIHLSIILGVALAVGGCAATTSSPGPASPAGSAEPSVSAEPGAASPGAPSPSEAASPSAAVPGGEGLIDPATPTACFGLETADCARARALAAGVLTPDDPPVVYVQAGPFGCAAGDVCPNTLLARPAGDVLLEFASGDPISVHVAVGPAVVATRSPALGIQAEPSSPRVSGGGPVDLTLGHCGLFSGIDHDGAWWDPVGPVAADHADSVNAAAGTLTLSDPGHATFRSEGGLVVQLVRREGPKFLPGCM